MSNGLGYKPGRAADSAGPVFLFSDTLPKHVVLRQGKVPPSRRQGSPGRYVGP